MQEKIIVVASNTEFEQIRLLTKIKIIKIGIGYANVIESLKDVDKNTHLINIGYAGSNILPRGEVVKVKNCKMFHPVAGDFKESVYNLNGNVDCYTSGDFVTQTTITEPVVFDMELASICALGFKNIESYKVVSDTLNLKQYNEADYIESFKKIIKEIEK